MAQEQRRTGDQPERRSRASGRSRTTQNRGGRKKGRAATSFALLYVVFVIGISALLACIGWVAANDVLALNKEQKTVTVTISSEDSFGDVADMLKENATIKLHLKPTDTTKEVYEKLNALIDEVKNTPLDSSFDHVAALLASMPRLLLKFVVWFLKTLDYFGMLPTFLTDLSPFHGTVIFTSMGSLGIPPIVHHLYNFGNLPVFVAFGRKYRKVELDLQGKPVTRRYVDFVMNTDERIVDGFYYATVMKYFEKLLREPEQLDLPPEEVIRDIP